MKKIQKELKTSINPALPLGYLSETQVANMLNRKVESLHSAHSRGTLTLPRIKTEGKQIIYKEATFYKWLNGLEERTNKKCVANDNKKRKVSNESHQHKPSKKYIENYEEKEIPSSISSNHANQEKTNKGGSHV